MRITGGMVSYGHGKKDDPADQYSQSKKAIVELRFDVAEDGDETAMLNRASALALAKVNELVGLKTPQVAAQAGSTASATAPATSNPKPRAKRKPAEIAEAEIIIEANPAPKPVQTNVDDFIIDAEPVVQISDADLKSACAKTSQRLGGNEHGAPVKIKTFAATFRTDATKAFQVADIAQARRKEFLDGLEKLT